MLPRLVVLVVVGLAAAFSLTALTWSLGHGWAAHSVLGLVAVIVLVAALLWRRDFSADVIVPQIVARRGPFTAAIAFGVVLGAGLASQRRGYWAALIIAAVGAPSLWVAAAGTGTYALVRCSAPLVSVGCDTQECVLGRLKRVRALLSYGAATVLLSSASVTALVVFIWR